MNEPAQTHESGSSARRPGASVVTIILLLIIATVGGSFLYSGGGVGPDPIEMFSQTGSPTVLLEMRAASTIAGPEFPNEMVNPDGLPKGKPLFISDKAGLTSADVKSAGARKQESEWVIEVEFTEDGAKKLTSLTRELIVDDMNRELATERLAILLDGKLAAAPVVRHVIDGGKAQLHLHTLSEAEATKLAKGIVGAK
jgi:preprotein translocase subunit SecD